MFGNKLWANRLSKTNVLTQFCPWIGVKSVGQGKRLATERSWVWILPPDTRWIEEKKKIKVAEWLSIFYMTKHFFSLQLFIKSVALMIEEARELFDSAPSKLSEDVAAHFRRLEEDDSAKFFDPPPQFSSVHRVQTRRQAILQRSHVRTLFQF